MNGKRDQDGRWKFPYSVPDGITVFKRKGASARSKWMIAYRLHPRGKREVKAVSTNAKVVRRRILRLAQLMEDAVTNPKVAYYFQQARVPIAQHLDDFEKDLLAGDITTKQAGQVKSRAKWVCDHHPHPDDPGRTGIERITHLSKLGVKQALRHLRLKGSGVKGRKPASKRTSNHYLRAIKQFARFLTTTPRRLRSDPIREIKAINWRTDVRHNRQDLGDAAAARLIDAARFGPTVLGIDGPDRAMLYETALETGFRGRELGTLTPRRCQLEADHPVVICKAGYSKHKREDQQPVRREFAAKLKGYLKGKPLDEPIWRVPKEPVDLVLPDLDRARDWWVLEAADAAELTERLQSDFLLYVDHEGRYADFHALRHTYVCRLVRAGVSPKECQVLARHASITTTMDYYAHLRIHDTAGAVNRVPALPPAAPAAGAASAQRARATGTYGNVEPDAQRRAAQAQRPGDASCHLLSICTGESTSGGTPVDSAQNDDRQGVTAENEVQLAGLEPATFGSVDRRVNLANPPPPQPLTTISENARSAKRSAPSHADLERARQLTNFDALDAAVNRLKTIGFNPDHYAGLTALHAAEQGKEDRP